MDMNIESWMISIHGLSFIPGAVLTSFIISKYGRKHANITSVILIIIGWLCNSILHNINLILVGRFLQGVSLGISSMLCPLLLGEYTTPKYRGTFIALSVSLLLLGTLIVHKLGSIISWQETSLICLGLAVLHLILAILSPETPVFLATRGRYEECRKVFYWLRFHDEKAELEAMIENALTKEAAKGNRHTDDKIKNKLLQFTTVLKKPKFYKPLILMLHLDVMLVYSGHIMMVSLTVDVFRKILGDDADVSLHMLITDILKMISSFSAIILITKFRRRLMLQLLVALNILALILISAYLYAAETGILQYPVLGALSIYLLLFAIYAGPVPLGCTISGEIFPLEYKRICPLITTVSSSIFITIEMKMYPYLQKISGLHGIFLIKSIVITYCLLVSCKLMPETRNETLQNIESMYSKKQLYKRQSISRNEESVIMKVESS
ncbi:facilitated trehalose transporter Tret1-2 homolog [Achroia grisella]|uniref:facilitated trehalose transporter Tret1-2 homolog n=1 Tax=Achroia grisella TaxID=688607 RepID=UPI0027D2152B|nr:facilitated trehalose transporter Tret1-2 homolog [Achroia grisella]